MFAPRWLSIVVAVVGCSARDAAEPLTRGEPTPAPSGSVPAAPTKPATPSGDDADSLGALSFGITEGTPAARAHFSRGLLALHSFWYDEAIRQFDAAIEADPSLRMAYWGAAMSRCKLLWGEDDLVAARRIVTRMPDPDGLPPREQAWVSATLDLLDPGNVRDSRKRFATAMEAVHTQFPDDESATFLAVALLATTRPEDPDDLFVRLRAAALAQGVFAHNPKHPGAAHYAIHAYDMTALAPLGLPLALTYAQIAPAAFHARHMPAHIFSQLGMWKQAIASCKSAWDASVAVAQQQRLSADHYDFHSLNWQIEMSFELGLRKDADAALALFANAVRDGADHSVRRQYADQVASYMKRTGEWARVDELLAPLAAQVAAQPASAGRAAQPHAHCAPSGPAATDALLEKLAVLGARMNASAMQRDPRTKRLVADMDALRAELRPFLRESQSAEAVAKLDAAYARRRLAWLARAAGDDRALLKVLRASVSDQEGTGGETVHSGFVLHEEIADTLMRLDRPAEAAPEYQRTLANHPGRAHSLLGAARAAAKNGDRELARTRYQQLLAQWANADAGTDGLDEAKAAVAP